MENVTRQWITRGAALLAVAGAALIALTAATYVIAGWTATRLDDTERAKLTRAGFAHAFVALKDGVTHYRDEGRADLGTIVLIHGVQNASYTYEAYWPKLTAAGYRVIAYDLYGRGFSDTPWARYDAPLFVGQLSDLLDALNVDTPIHLVGYSLGAAVAIEFGAAHPEEVASVYLISPAGLAPKHYPGYLSLPVVGEVAYRVFGDGWLTRAAQVQANKAPDPAAFMAAYERSARYRGHAEAIMWTRRAFPYFSIPESYRAFARTNRPLRVIWGTADGTYPFAQSKALMSLVPEAELEAVEGEGHAIAFAAPDRVTDDLLEFLSRTALP